ncbi:5'-3' exonuclease [Halalkalibacter nanhaiisediminis]|uniref:5'-3' exonuclease n=1 Tax=Halalkalibacter nanhaiisediminis TaxID=688079 RepID=A0A562QQY2_9BACI|nr:5'-3' exonuclease [Halalkalibacter nanhaiisediminis]
MNKDRVMLVDGMALLFRSFFATAMSGYYMVNSKGIPTNAIHGFIKHLFTAINAHQPTHIICCWDMGSKTFRNEIFPDYKANRGEPPVELIPQFDLVKDVVDELSIPNVGLAGFEADDCIGTLARHYSKNSDVLILTGDQDILQLIDKNVSVILLKKGYGNYQVFNEGIFFEEKGITPRQMVDLKALMGDSSDNYPGVKGIGEKTALQLLKKYGTIEGILDNLSSLTPSQRLKIENDQEILHICRQLAAIHCEVEVSCDIVEALYQIDEKRMLAKFEELELKNLDGILQSRNSVIDV